MVTAFLDDEWKKDSFLKSKIKLRRGSMNTLRQRLSNIIIVKAVSDLGGATRRMNS